MQDPKEYWSEQVEQAANDMGLAPIPNTGRSAQRHWQSKLEEWENARAGRNLANQGAIHLGTNLDTRAPAYIPQDTFQRHTYIVGDSGSGKTTLIKQLIEQHIERHEGFAVIDPKGGLLEHIKERIACAYHRSQNEELLDRLVVVDPKHPTHTATFNPLEPLPNTSPAEQASELVSTFHKIWQDAWGPRMEDLMRNTFIAASQAGVTLVELQRFYTDAMFRATAMTRVSHPDVAEYFQEGGEFDQLTRTAGAAVTFLGPVRTKLRAFLYDERVSQLLSSPQSSFSLRDIMDNRKILVVALDGLRDATWLLSALFMSKITLAAFSRTDILEEQDRVPFYLYVDEFSKFANEDFEDVLSLARSFGLSIIMAHQNYGQVSSSLRAVAMGNSQLRIAFRLGERGDADYYARQIFTYDEDEIKREKLLQSGEVSYTYRSAGEQRDRLAQGINQLPDLTFYAQDKLNREVWRIRTAHLPPAFRELSMSEKEATDYIANLPIGKKYLVDREQIKARQSRSEAVVSAPLGTSPDQSDPQPPEGFGDTKPATLPRQTT